MCTRFICRYSGIICAAIFILIYFHYQKRIHKVISTFKANQKFDHHFPHRHQSFHHDFLPSEYWDAPPVGGGKHYMHGKRPSYWSKPPRARGDKGVVFYNLSTSTTGDPPENTDLKHILHLLRYGHLRYTPPYEQTVHGRYFDARWSIPTLLHLGIGLPKAKFVHLSKPLPSPTVVMATSKKYFRRTLNVIASVQKFLPKLKIELYGIGMTKKQILTARSLCNVTYKRFYFGLYPHHFYFLGHFYWKPIILQLALKRHGVVLWLDAKTVLTSGNLKPIMSAAQRSGVQLFGGTDTFTTYQKTDYKMFSYLPTSTDVKQSKQALVAPMLICNTKKIHDQLMTWLVLCALDKKCYYAPDAHAHCRNLRHNGKPLPPDKIRCHRYDQSATNILLKNVFAYDTSKFVSDHIISKMQKRSVPISKDLKYCKRKRG